MGDKVTGLKNILWAIGIVVCLLALFVGCIVAAVSPYHGEADPRTPDLNAVRDQNTSTDVSALTFVEPDGQLHELRESKDAGEEYLRGAVFLTDSEALGSALRGRSFRSEVHGREGGVRILIFEIPNSDKDTQA